jgi:hypothetical protein
VKNALITLAAVALTAALAAGCSAEDTQQRAARQAAEHHVRNQSEYTGEAYCTDSASTGWFAKRFTEEYVCAVRRDEGDCDWFLVRFDERRGRVTVVLDERAAGCVLPV